MKATRRRYRNEDDYQRIRTFLRQVFLLNDRREFSWHVARLDYWRWHGILNMGDGQLDRDLFLWETEDGSIAGVVNRESAGDAFLQVHPQLRTPELEEEMVVTAEETLHIPGQGGLTVSIWTDANDTLRQDILKKRGYTRSRWVESQWRRDLNDPIPAVPVPAGYVVRSLADETELPGRSWASWKAFHPDSPDEGYDGWAWYLNVQSAPLYRRDLDLVAVSSEGEIVSFATIWYDDVTRSAYFEPVGTMPRHQRRGLARAVMREGLRRLQRMGATRAFVGGYAPAANALYASVLSPARDLSEAWTRTW